MKTYNFFKKRVFQYEAAEAEFVIKGTEDLLVLREAQEKISEQGLTFEDYSVEIIDEKGYSTIYHDIGVEGRSITDADSK